MKKIIITDENIINKILENKANCKELTIYISNEHSKLAIIKSSALKRRVFIPIEKISRIIKNI